MNSPHRSSETKTNRDGGE